MRARTARVYPARAGCHLKSTSLNWSLNPRTRGSTSI
jgi:hypothetical protein